MVSCYRPSRCGFVVAFMHEFKLVPSRFGSEELLADGASRGEVGFGGEEDDLRLVFAARRQQALSVALDQKFTLRNGLPAASNNARIGSNPPLTITILGNFFIEDFIILIKYYISNKYLLIIIC